MVRFRDVHTGIGYWPTGPLNAITDVAGVRVGHTTIIDEQPGEGRRPVRTGVTIVQPRPGFARDAPCFAGSFTLNGNGEMTGLEWVRESGLLTTPIGITNTFSVGVVRDAIAAYESRNATNGTFWSMPVVGETFDGVLNDIHGRHVRAEHVDQALDAAASGPVAEGNVGGGTGNICHGFKGGIGTSSRTLPEVVGGWTVGVLVQANYGEREDLRVDGVPVGKLIPPSEVPIPLVADLLPGLPAGAGSIIVVVATDAPLTADQCQRLAKQASIGLARMGGGASDASGDIVLAFSTGNDGIPAEYYTAQTPQSYQLTSLSHQAISQVMLAAVDATQEAILNAMVAAEPMTARNGVVVQPIGAERLAGLLDRYRTWPPGLPGWT